MGLFTDCWRTRATVTKIAPQARMPVLDILFSKPLSRGQAFGQLNPDKKVWKLLKGTFRVRHRTWYSYGYNIPSQLLVKELPHTTCNLTSDH